MTNDSVYEFKSDFLKFCAERGLVYQSTATKALDEMFLSSKVKGYIGFDCTAESLHIGSLVQLMFLRNMRRFGHIPVVLIGDTTAMIGDPSGKNKSRTLLSDERVHQNVIGITNLIKRIIPDDNLIIVKNSDWLNSLNIIDFLREIGAKFSINRMMEMETFANRLKNEQNLSFLEFSYVLLQSYDFLHLNKTEQCRLQIGGSDQWGNIVSGIDLIRRFFQTEAFGITTPLLTNFRGEKMGKTVDGAVWLDSRFYSDYDFWQYFRNIHDDDVKKCFLLLTELNIDEINEITRVSGSWINEAKKRLANEITKICRGTEVAAEIERSVSEYFENKDDSELPVKEVFAAGDSLSLIQILRKVDFAASNSEARRLISSLGCKVNGVTIDDLEYSFSIPFESFVLSSGKKRHIRVAFIAQ